MNAAYTKSQRLLECCAIGIFILFAGWGLWRLVAAAGWQALPILLVTAPLAWVAIDLLSGLLHWIFDSWGSVKTPVIGNAFIRPFREHHVDPQKMTRHDFIETHGASCFAALPFLTVGCLMPLAGWLSLLLQAFLLWLALGALATNQCHKWAHMEEAATPRPIRWAQHHHLVLPREQHRLHHTAPFNTHFCMACGWLNPLFNAVLRAWR